MDRLLRLALLGLAVLSVGAAWAGEAAADLILTRGRIVTANRAFDIVPAMAVRGDRILAVGDEEKVLACRGSETRVIDLRGGCVLPGLIDSHCHPSSAAVAELDHPRPPMTSIEDVLAYVASRTRAVPEGEWIVIAQRFLTRLREHRYPTREELDRVAPRHPVIFRTGPDCAVNTAAMRAAGIDPGGPYAPPGRGKAERDPRTGTLTGVFRNMNGVFMAHVRSEPISDVARYQAVKRLLALYNRAGLTSASDREVGERDIAVYRRLLADGALRVRITLARTLDTSGSEEEIDARLRRIASLPIARDPNPMLRLKAVKIFVDGGMLTGSAYMREPWGVSAIYRISDPSYRGIQFIPDDRLRFLVKRAQAHGLQLVAHCQGDAAIDALLRACEAADREHPIRARRMCIAHGSFMRLDLVRRAVRIGVVADSQPAWLHLDASVLLRQFGARRMRYFIPFRTWFAEGGVVGGGSDHMIGPDPDTSINPYNPFLGMWIAITRRARWVEGPVIPEEAIGREQAIRLYTTNAAYVEFSEKEKGSLEPGKLADFIVIDRDILTCPVDAIRAIRVGRTYVGGRCVYARG